jgi:hypothetical protein
MEDVEERGKSDWRLREIALIFGIGHILQNQLTIYLKFMRANS